MSEETLGRYSLIRKIATGGMAEIWLAKSDGPEGFRKRLVVKRILSHLAEDEEFVRMFLDEARIAARLNHPNIAQIFDLGEADGSYYIAMEYVPGKDLRRMYQDAVRAKHPLPIPLALRILIEAAKALDYAHHATDDDGTPLDIVHRDVSPQNILVTYDGSVKVVDFGIAKAADQASQTRAGVLKGKYSYMSPEQAGGDPVDLRTDVFALGIVGYELVSGFRLFKRDTEVATLAAVRNCNVPPPSAVNSDVPRSLDPLIMKALAKEPRDRFHTAGELALALEEYLRNGKHAASSTHLAELMHQLYPDYNEDSAMRPAPTPSLSPAASSGRRVPVHAKPSSLPPGARTRSLGKLEARGVDATDPDVVRPKGLWQTAGGVVNSALQATDPHTLNLLADESQEAATMGPDSLPPDDVPTRTGEGLAEEAATRIDVPAPRAADSGATDPDVELPTVAKELLTGKASKSSAALPKVASPRTSTQQLPKAPAADLPFPLPRETGETGAGDRRTRSQSITAPDFTPEKTPVDPVVEHFEHSDSVPKPKRLALGPHALRFALRFGVAVGALALVALALPTLKRWVAASAPAAAAGAEGAPAAHDAGCLLCGLMPHDQGKLTVVTNPASTVYLGGEKLGPTPIVEAPVAAGHVELRVVNDTVALDQKLAADVRPDQLTTLRHDFQQGSLTLPVEAGHSYQVLFHDELLGHVPGPSIDLVLGTHVLTLVDDKTGARETRTVEVTAGKAGGGKKPGKR